MMSKINKEINEYITEIKKNLICSSSQKNAVISDLRDSVINFVEENNIDDIHKVYDQFGTPQDIANQSISDTEPQKIKKNYRHHRVIIIGVAVAVLIVAIVIIWAALDGHKSTDGYFVDTFNTTSEATATDANTQNINSNPLINN